MKLNLTLSYLGAWTRIHDSDKPGRGVSYFYEIENKFQAKLLKREVDVTFSGNDIFVAVSDEKNGWSSSETDHRVEVEIAQAKANFERNSLFLQRACEQLGLIYKSYSRNHKNSGWGEPFTTLHLTILINEELDNTISNLCSHIQNGDLQSWLLQIRDKLRQELPVPVRRATAQSMPRQQNRQHLQDFCENCLKLGRLCSLKMERSTSRQHPNDVIVKGLPLDTTSEQLEDLFGGYGNILRIHLPLIQQDLDAERRERQEWREEFGMDDFDDTTRRCSRSSRVQFSSRIAFITFDDPRSALRIFNNPEVTIPSRAQRPQPSLIPVTPAVVRTAGMPQAVRGANPHQVVAEAVSPYRLQPEQHFRPPFTPMATMAAGSMPPATGTASTQQAAVVDPVIPLNEQGASLLQRFVLM